MRQISRWAPIVCTVCKTVSPRPVIKKYGSFTAPPVTLEYKGNGSTIGLFFEDQPGETNFVVTNTNDFDIQNLEIQCKAYGSGQWIAGNKRPFPGVFKAHQVLPFPMDVNLRTVVTHLVWLSRAPEVEHQPSL
jgi:hypothetical protein